MPEQQRCESTELALGSKDLQSENLVCFTLRPDAGPDTEHNDTRVTVMVYVHLNAFMSRSNKDLVLGLGSGQNYVHSPRSPEAQEGTPHYC